MIITISGVSGSGKSTTAEILAQKLSYKKYSMGDLQRKLAEKYKLTTVDFSKMEAKDPKFDLERDNIMKELGEKEDDFVIDTWLGARFIPHAFKVFLDSDLEKRAQRIFEENNLGRNAAGVSHKRISEKKFKSVDDVKEFLMQKETINRDRWLRLYKFDFLDKSNYDLVLDTTDMTIREIVNEILQEMK
ncbi:MAG: cytidylate kinase family protein [Nanoarchaeota archaeon]|nr:cytidylate kinase family protein [Nanoarchaeota archaeon]